MKLLMISGDRSILQGKKGAFWYTLEEMRQYWERIDVICPGSAGIENANPFSNVFFHPSPHGLWYQSRWILKKGEELIRAHHHDVMTAHEYPPFYNGIGACHLHRATGVPYALEVHHIVGWPVASSCTEWIGRIMSRWQIPKSAYHAAAVRVVNRAVQEQLVTWGIPKEKIRVVPSFYLDAALLVHNPSIPKRYDVAFCGRLVRNKGVPELIHAVTRIENATLLIIGDGPERARCEALVQSLNATDRVTFTGWLPTNAEVYRAMQSATVFAMNSRSEGGPRAALEAMALGLPIVTTRVGVMPEVIQESVNGLFTNGEIEDLRWEIHHLLGTDELRERMEREGPKVLQRFERKRLVGEYAEFLQLLKKWSAKPMLW